MTPARGISVLGFLLVVVFAVPCQVRFLEREIAPPPYEASLSVRGGSLIERGQTYLADAPDLSGVVALDGAVVVLQEPRIVMTGGGNFGALAAGASSLIIEGGSIKTVAEGARAVAATRNSTVALTDVTLVTESDGSIGLLATVSGAIAAKGLSITTAGEESVAVSAQGEGSSVVLNGATIKTLGKGAPVLESSGDIRVANSALTALGSEAAVIQGAHTLVLKDSVLLGSADRGVLFVRGEAPAPGSGTFTMTGGSLTALDGPVFEAQNTKALVELRLVAVVANDGLLVRVTQGADLVLTADSQALEGDAEAEANCSLSLSLRNGSVWSGSADTLKTAKDFNLTIESASLWRVTRDSRVSLLRIEGGTAASLSQSIQSDGHTIWYKSSLNSWLGGRQVVLEDGGFLTPY